MHTYIHVHMIFIELSCGREQIRSAGWLWTALVIGTVYREEAAWFYLAEI